MCNCTQVIPNDYAEAHWSRWRELQTVPNSTQCYRKTLRLLFEVYKIFKKSSRKAELSRILYAFNMSLKIG